MTESAADVGPRWSLVLGSDGTVLAASGGAPASWVGQAIEGIEQLPPRVRAAGRALVEHVHRAPRGAATSSSHPLPDLPGAPPLEIIAVEAVPLRRAPTDLRQLLTSAMAVLEQQAATLDVDVRVEASGPIPTDARLDPEKIAWAVTTLVGNALRYVRHGTRRMPGGSITVDLGFVAERDEVVIVVEDDGPGIPPDKLPSLFRRGSGTTHAAGLGLMLIHDVVVAHGGTIDLKSSTEGLSHGTTITLRIPAR